MSELIQDIRDLDPRPIVAAPQDGTDANDQKTGGDGDGTDAGDSDGTDAGGDTDGTDTGDSDGTDAGDADGTDNA
jgi:hypothetical protein